MTCPTCSQDLPESKPETKTELTLDVIRDRLQRVIEFRDRHPEYTSQQQEALADLAMIAAMRDECELWHVEVKS